MNDRQGLFLHGFAVHRVARRLLTDPDADPAGTLAASGWSVHEERTEEIAARYGRDLTDPFGSSGGDSATGPPWLATIVLRARQER
jgi:hypothetical protein